MLTYVLYLIIGSVLAVKVGGVIMGLWFLTVAVDFIVSSLPVISVIRAGRNEDGKYSWNLLKERHPMWKAGYEAGKKSSNSDCFYQGLRRGYRQGRYDEFWVKDDSEKNFIAWTNEGEKYPYEKEE